MSTVLLGHPLASFEEFRAREDGCDYFHLTLPRIREWIGILRSATQQITESTQKRQDLEKAANKHERFMKVTKEQRQLEALVYKLTQVPSNEFLDLVAEMVDESPEERPNSATIKDRLESMAENMPSRHTWNDHKWRCCTREREVYQVAEEDELYDRYRFAESLKSQFYRE